MLGRLRVPHRWRRQEVIATRSRELEIWATVHDRCVRHLAHCHPDSVGVVATETHATTALVAARPRLTRSRAPVGVAEAGGRAAGA